MTPLEGRTGFALLLAASALATMSGCHRGTTRVPDTPSAYEAMYARTRYNWAFRRAYPSVDRLFNGFDYGHAIVHETLLRHPSDAARRLEGRIFTHLTRQVLPNAPSLAMAERSIAPAFYSLVPEVALMFEWAHVLHRQLYDVLADPRIPRAERDAQVREMVDAYRARRDLAFSAAPKSMALMEGATYSLTFRRQDPRFSGLLWSYHWLQLVLYDALLADSTSRGQRANVDAVVARFWGMVADAPAKMPSVMPAAAGVAPRFSTAYPEAAIIFDNLHALHDVVTDVLAAPGLSLGERRTLILAAAAAYRDSTTAVTTRDEWHAMARLMGVDRMGGVPRFAATGAPRD